jgi:hypothetical protein
MRLVLIGCTIVAAAMVAGVSSSDAQFSRRYCTQGGSSQSSGEPDCSYNTWEQCMASASGLARYCAENPFWKPEGSRDPKPKGHDKPRRNN